MKIGIVSLSSGYLGDSIRVEKFSENLINMGYDVVILNPLSKFFPHRKSEEIPRLSTFVPMIWNKVGKFPILKNSIFQQLLFKHFFRIMSYILCKMAAKEHIDLLQAETHMAAIMALPVKQKLNIPLFFDIHSGTLIDETKKIIHPSEEFLEYLKTVEKNLILFSDQIFVPSKKMKILLERSYDLKKINVVTNGSDVYPGLSKNFNFPLKVIYAGSFSYWERVEDYLDAIKLINTDMFNFYLIGNGSQKEELMNKIKEEEINVTYLGYLPRKILREYLKKMHIGVAPMANEVARKYASSIKTFEYLSMGLPVVCAEVGEWAEVIKTNNCGFVVPPENPKAIADSLNFYTKGDIWKVHSNNGIQLIEKEYTWEKIISQLKPLYESSGKKKL